MESSKKKYRFKNKNLAGISFSTVILLGSIGLTVKIIDKIRSGHGLDYYFTGHTFQMNYTGTLIILAFIPLVLLFTWAIKAKKED